MKTTLLILLALAATAAAQDAPAPAPRIPVETQARAMLIYDEGNVEEAWIEVARGTEFRYRVTATAIDRKVKKLSEVASIYFYEPPAYKAARDLYQGLEFEKAMAEFIRVRDALENIKDLPNNYSTLAGFYVLECLRQMGDLDGLAAALEGFREGALTREHHLRQLELYVLWEGVRTKGWQRLDLLCKDRTNDRMPGYQRAQVEYCHGLALEGLDRPLPALNAYGRAITADYGGSKRLVRNALNNSLRLYKKDPEVQLAIKLWGTPDENPNSAGRLRLEEAAALAASYQTVLGTGETLPEEYRMFLQYVPKDEA